MQMGQGTTCGTAVWWGGEACLGLPHKEQAEHLRGVKLHVGWVVVVYLEEPAANRGDEGQPGVKTVPLLASLALDDEEEFDALESVKCLDIIEELLREGANPPLDDSHCAAGAASAR